MLDVVLDRLHDDDGIVHDEADRENEAEEGERVDREAEHRKDDERADEGDRHGQQGNERRPPPLQEQEDDDDDEDDRLEQRVLDLLDALGDRYGRVEGDDVLEIVREPRP